MFTGIIETTGKITKIVKYQKNLSFYIESFLANKINVGDSVSHNGVCLTIEEILSENLYKVTAIEETLSKTNLGLLKENDLINLEPSLVPTGKIDGHFVQGHIDCTGIIFTKTNKEGSYEFQIVYPTEFKPYVIPRGSIALDGISLTISQLNDEIIHKNDLPTNQSNTSYLAYSNYCSLFVNIIPHTYQITNVKKWEKGTILNIEFDVLGKYIYRFFQISKQSI